MTALVIDVGGTHTRLALARPNGERAQLDDVEVVDTPSGHLHEVIAAFLANHPKLELSGIAVAAAGRVRRLPGRTAVSLTNTALSIEREDLQAVLSHERVWLMNDLAAVAAALPWLLPAELEAVGSERSSVPGHRIVVGLGTGFGAAALTAKGTVLETEAGHMSLAAVSASERRWLDMLAPLGRCAVEQVLSGPGLLRLHEVVSRQPGMEHEELLRQWTQGESSAVRTMSVFSTWLGRTVETLCWRRAPGAESPCVVAWWIVWGPRWTRRLSARALRTKRLLQPISPQCRSGKSATHTRHCWAWPDWR